MARKVFQPQDLEQGQQATLADTPEGVDATGEALPYQNEGSNGGFGGQASSAKTIPYDIRLPGLPEPTGPQPPPRATPPNQDWPPFDPNFGEPAPPEPWNPWNGNKPIPMFPQPFPQPPQFTTNPDPVQREDPNPIPPFGPPQQYLSTDPNPSLSPQIAPEYPNPIPGSPQFNPGSPLHIGPGRVPNVDHLLPGYRQRRHLMQLMQDRAGFNNG